MLTADLAQSFVRGGRVQPRYVRPDDGEHLRDAAELVRLFAEHEGRTRGELDERLEEFVGVGTDYKILRGLIKLLTDRCEFETSSAKDPVEIRRVLFLKARARHPVVAQQGAREELIDEAARELECPPEAVARGLYADLPERQRLASFDRLTPAELLDLYNVAQAQALLYRCVQMRLFVEPQAAEGYRELFGAIKAYRLLHTVRGSAAEGYEVRLDGPVSMFHRSQKYGVQMAVFLPALLLCAGWRMRAEIAQRPAGSVFYELDSRQTRLRSHYVSVSPYENPTLRQFEERWEAFDTPWSLRQSGEVVDLGESVFVPDFTLTHPDGRRVYLEVLGFWTPRHLHERLREFEHARVSNFILAAWDELRGSRDPLARVPPNTVVFKTRLDPVVVEAQANKIVNSES